MNNLNIATEKIGEKIVELNIPSEILWFMMSIAILFFILMSFVLNYHWKKYIIQDDPKIFAKGLYWIVSFILIIVMAVAVVAFEGI